MDPERLWITPGKKCQLVEKSTKPTAPPFFSGIKFKFLVTEHNLEQILLSKISLKEYFLHLDTSSQVKFIICLERKNYQLMKF
jgi:hypothetical protein